MASKIQERIYLDWFLKKERIVCQSIEESESPDFFLTLESKRIAVEITNLHREPKPNRKGSKSKQQESQRTQWLKELSDLYYSSNRIPIHLLLKVPESESYRDATADILAVLSNCNELGAWESRQYKVKSPAGTFKLFVYRLTGEYYNHSEKGRYVCKQCGSTLFQSSSKFKSGCGWPSFDDQLEGAVTKKTDADGIRTEILCANCGGHLGHVFVGEGLTPKNTRYCVNSISMDFVPADALTTQRAVFASGCFWGTQYHLQRVPGVISTTVGYTGGHVDSPTYEQVCSGTTGHAESLEVIFDPAKTSYEQLAKVFFETHDFSQLNRQGPDLGHQYRSAIFYLDEDQKKTALKLTGLLSQKGFDVKTQVSPEAKFWPAEEYHQDYYNKNGQTPYCHVRKKVF